MNRLRWAGPLLLALFPFASLVAAANGPPASRYGPDDRIGAANNLSPAIVMAAAKLVRTGKVYSLAMEFGDPRVNGKPFANRTYAIHVEQQHPPGTTIHDDRVTMWNGAFGTSMDGLGHVGRGALFYNRTPASAIYGEDGLKMLAMSDVPPIVSRGILLDFPRYYGVDRLLPSKRIDRAEILAVAKSEHISIAKGDVVLIHTGWQSLLIADMSQFDRQPGLGLDGARYLAAQGVVAIGSDNHGVEAIPQTDDAGMPYPVHPLLIADNGIYLLEDVKTDELARDRVYEFLFVLGQPKLAGAAQTPINPIAIR